MNGYDRIKTLAKASRVKVGELLVLAENNDPFYCGSPAQIEHAQWFADVYARYGNAFGDHIRRVHYRIVSQPIPVLMPNGTPWRPCRETELPISSPELFGAAYENTDACWAYITLASKYARTLGLVDVSSFRDARNPDPLIHRDEPRDPEDEPRVEFYSPEFDLVGIAAELNKPCLSIPEPMVSGYDYSAADQPYLLEVWCEKSTMNDVLIPICRRYGANLVTSVGFQSITAAVSIINRAIHYGKPARIFYISDHDPAGDRMPVAVARQIEYWVSQFGLDIDIALEPLVLTREQVEQYGLPRIPIKATDMRAAKFEAINGEGAVELDALEALQPGELGRIVREAMSPYIDGELARRIGDQRDEVDEDVVSTWHNLTASIQEARDDLAAAVDAVYDDYRAELADLAARMDVDLDPLRRRAADLVEIIVGTQDEFDPDLPPRLASDLEPPESDSAWLFRTDRGYCDQLAAYRGEVRHA